MRRGRARIRCFESRRFQGAGLAASVLAVAGGAFAQATYPDEPVSSQYLTGAYGFSGIYPGLGSDPDASFRPAAAGDINNDGLDDIIVSIEEDVSSRRGICAVVFGRDDAEFDDPLRLDELDGTNGFLIGRFDAFPLQNGSSSATGVGDVNGDGVDDLFVDVYNRRLREDLDGTIGYVVYGRDGGGFPGELLLDKLGPDQAVPVVLGGDFLYPAGLINASPAGDLNADGTDDLVIAQTSSFSPDGDPRTRAFVIYGQPGGFGGALVLHDLAPGEATLLLGIDPEDRFGRALAPAGDINGDGVDDLAVGAPGLRGTAVPTTRDPGAAYVFFGRPGGLGVSIAATELDGSNGFAFLPGPIDEQPIAAMGMGVAGAGDLNGDGIDDVAFGSPGFQRDDVFAGAAFVIFGRTDGFPASSTPADLTPETGLVIEREPQQTALGWSLGRAGDLNADGAPDLIIGSPRFFADTFEEAIIVFGRTGGGPFTPSGTLDLTQTDGSEAARIQGPRSTQFGREVTGLGDLNGDGVVDVGISQRSRAESARFYVHFGGGICRVDLDANGSADLFDFLAFLTLFDDRDDLSDWNGDGDLNLLDFLAFQNDFDAGCP